MPHIVARGAVVLAMLVAATGCSGPDSQPAPSAAGAVFDELVARSVPGQWRSTGTDVVEVWVCHVPNGSTAKEYGGLPLRLALAPAPLAGLFQQQVSRYFDSVSHGAYTPSFVAGGEVSLAVSEGSKECVESAIAKASATANVVLAVADAEQAPPASGGIGSGGNPTSTRENVAVTRRYAYVGGADFDRATWGDNPPMDLVEHELGHTLGWVHSGVSSTGDYLSALDVMSNSAAPRDVNPDRRDAPDALALHRVLAGWIPAADVVVADGAVTATLAPGNGAAGTRMLVLPIDAAHFLTVELVPDDGYDDHLPRAGLAVHRVSVTGGAVSDFEPLGEAPFTRLLQPGDTVAFDGWTVQVGPGGQVTATPT